MADSYSRKVDVINRGLSGYNTRKVLAVLPRILDQFAGGSLLFATCLLGTNDSVPDADTGFLQLSGKRSAHCSHVPLAEYEISFICLH